VQGRKWWDIVVAAAVVIVGVLVVLEPPANGDRLVGALIILALIAIYYYAFGRRAKSNTTAEFVFQLVLIVGVVAGAWFSPNILTLQALVLPLLWYLSPTIHRAIILNVITVVCITVAYATGLGGSASSFVQGGVIESVSLAFSIALGLWINRIADYGNERGRLLDELTAAQSELELANREAGAAAERERLAREIHDTIAQSLTGIVMLAQRAKGEVARGGKGEVAGQNAAPAPATETITLIETMAREALDEARALVATIAGLPSQDADLAAAVARLSERFGRETGIQVSAAVNSGPISRDLEVVLLRCVQEALANVRKHSGASSASITIDRHGNEIRLTARDNGRGLVDYDPQREQGFGLSGMRDRIELVGGELNLAEADGGGTILSVTISVPENASSIAASKTRSETRTEPGAGAESAAT
jgi:signal transduction histidine kinase